MTDEHVSDGFRERLQQQVDALGQSEVARRMSCSAATIHQLRTGRYPSDTARWERIFDATFTEEPVDCPVLGEISREACALHRSRPFAATNPVRVRLYHACKVCPNNPEVQTNE